MKRVGLTITAILIAALTIILMNSLKLQETVQLWEKYNIVYISSDYSEENVFNLLLQNGAEGIISRENSLFTVKNHMLPTLAPYNNEGFTSESMRSFFFTDKSDAYFLLYVPEDSLTQVTTILNKAKIPFGIDASAEYPALCPILCFAAFLALMMINRVAFSKAICLIPLISVSYAVPFYSVAASICCFLFIFCIVDMYEFRKGAAGLLLRKIVLYAVFAAGMASAALSGLKAFLLTITGLSSTLMLLHLRRIIIKTEEENSFFKPVLILTASWINPEKRYNLKTILTLMISCTCFLILSLFSGILNSGIKSQDLLLPSPSEYTEDGEFTAASYAEISGMHESLRNPDLTDFLNEKWYAETAAYRKVSVPYSTVEADEKVLLPSFEEENGLIVEKDKTLFSFDDHYISAAAEEFEGREGIEKLLVSQQGFHLTGYASTGKLETSPLIIEATALCALCFLVIAAIYCIKRHKK